MSWLLRERHRENLKEKTLKQVEAWDWRRYQLLWHNQWMLELIWPRRKVGNIINSENNPLNPVSLSNDTCTNSVTESEYHRHCVALWPLEKPASQIQLTDKEKLSSCLQQRIQGKGNCRGLLVQCFTRERHSRWLTQCISGKHAWPFSKTGDIIMGSI